MSRLRLTIAELLKLPSVQAQWCSSEPPGIEELSGVSTDSRTTQKNKLFFALVGEHLNGHTYIMEALQKGAVAAVANREWYHANRLSVGNAALITVPETLFAYQELARYYREKFDKPVIAVTGSSGKTTSKEMIAAVLCQQYTVLKNVKSFNNAVGVPATLFDIRPEHEIIITELGTNHFGELDRLSQIVQPGVCVLTNIGYAHLEFFHDLAGVSRAKMEIFHYADAEGSAIYNADDPWLAKQNFPVAHKTGYGLKAGEIRGEIIGCDSHANYTFKALNRTIHLNIPGRHNVYNALAAAAAGTLFNVDADGICRGLESAQAVEKRMQIMEMNHITILEDSYNNNPGSCRAALSTLSEIYGDNRARRIAILGDMMELGRLSFQEHSDLGDVIAAGTIDVLFAFGKEMRFTADRAVQLGFKNVHHFMEMEDLLDAVINYIQPGDVILIKGSRGMRMERVTEYIKQRMKK